MPNYVERVVADWGLLEMPNDEWRMTNAECGLAEMTSAEWFGAAGGWFGKSAIGNEEIGIPLHSARSAVRGSTRVARRAGKRAASEATAARRSATLP